MQVDDPSTSKIRLLDAATGKAVDLDGTGSGTHHTLLMKSASIANGARGTVSSNTSSSQVSNATGSSPTSGISSGTTAAIDIV